MHFFSMFKFKLPFFSKASRSNGNEKQRIKEWYRDSQRMRAEDRLYLEQLERGREEQRTEEQQTTK